MNIYISYSTGNYCNNSQASASGNSLAKSQRLTAVRARVRIQKYIELYTAPGRSAIFLNRTLFY